jgi:hypothetical protein
VQVAAFVIQLFIAMSRVKLVVLLNDHRFAPVWLACDYFEKDWRGPCVEIRGTCVTPQALIPASERLSIPVSS